MKKMRRIPSVLLIILIAAGSSFTCLPMFGQTGKIRLDQMDHKAWTAEDGAPTGILSIQEDADGSLWILTLSGLFRFDGIKFSPFRPAKGETQLPSTTFTIMYEDKRGVLWAGSGDAGVVSIAHGRVLRAYGANDGLPAGEVDAITASPEGAVIVSVAGSLFRLHGTRWAPDPISAGVAHESVTDMFFDRSENLWLSTNRSVWECAAQTAKCGRLYSGQNLIGVSFHQGADDRIYFVALNARGRTEVLRRLTAGEGPARQLRVSSLHSLLHSDGTVWANAAKGGVGRFDLATAAGGENAKTTDVYNHLDGLSSDLWVTAYEDSYGDTWVGTARGLDRFRVPHLIRQTDKFLNAPWALASCKRSGIWVVATGQSRSQILVNIQKEQAVLQSPLAGRNLFATCDFNGAVWLTGSSGIERHFGGKTTPVPEPSAPNSLLKISQVVAADDHLLYAVVQQSGLWKREGGAWQKVLSPALPSAVPTVLYLDTSRRLWAGYLDGSAATLLGTDGKTYHADTAADLGPVKCFSSSSYGMLAGGENGVALARRNGLMTLPFADTASVHGITGILEAPDGALWLNGLEGVVRIGAEEVREALVTPGYLMRSQLVSEAGIAGPSPQMHGLPSAAQDDQGLFWFISSLFVVKLDPTSFRPSRQAPILSSPDPTVDGEPIAPDHRIVPGFHTLRIGIAGRYITAPEKVRYRAKLEGLDKDWQDLGDRTEAVYAGLRPGRYRFLFMASNGDVWSSPDSTLQFTVLPHFYERPLFRLASVVAFGLVIWMVVRIRIAHVTSVIQRQQEARIDERLRIARELHDTLLQGLQALILRFHYATVALPESAEKTALESALVIGDRVMLEGRERVGDLRSSLDRCSDLMRRLEGVALDLNHDGTVDFVTTLNDADTPVSSEMLQEVYCIGREAITNAFHHAHASRIEVTLASHLGGMELTIQDNGIGLAGSAKPRRASGHWGLVGMRERANRVNATLRIDGVPGRGTTVLLQMQSVRKGKTPGKLLRAFWNQVSRSQTGTS